MKTRALLLLVAGAAAACSSPVDHPDAPLQNGDGGPGDAQSGGPPSFCYTINNNATCVQTPLGNVTLTSGNAWFSVWGQISVTYDTMITDEQTTELHDVYMSGQIPDGAALPQVANHVIVGFPVFGQCISHYPATPFSGCDEHTRHVVCDASATYNDQAATVTVTALDDLTLDVTMSAQLAVPSPDPCCENGGKACTASPVPSFDQSGFIPVTAKAHVQLIQ